MQCQKCRQSVRVDDSLQHLNAAAFKLLVDSSSTSRQTSSTRARQTRPTYHPERHLEYEKAALQSSPAVSKRAANKATSQKQNGSTEQHQSMSFVMLSESQVKTPNVNNSRGSNSSSRDAKSANDHLSGSEFRDDHAFSDKLKLTNRLWEILSARSDVDHPLCAECTDMIIDGLQKRLNNATRERDAYVEYLRNANADIPSEEETRQAQQTLENMRKRESASLAELEALEIEKAALDKELQDLDYQSKQLDVDEDNFWRERNLFTIAFSDLQGQRDSVETKLRHDKRQLESLARTNVFNDTFNIGHDGYFGTINNLRLGRLSSHPVEWPEINAAWGQACLLLHTVADKLGYTFQNYRLVPMGSTSLIQKLEYPQSTSTSNPAQTSKPKETSLELFSHGDMSLGLGGLWHKKFDTAMVAFLECLRQLGDHIKHFPIQGPPLVLPYDIRKDKIYDTSIRYSFSSEENWTKACKYVLTCCKFLLAHASNLHTPARHVPQGV